MKKTLTINLNNSVFHIDDDAYELLQSYLEEVSHHLQNERDKDEIMFDIEARVAEIFNEKMDKNKNVVTFTDVENVITLLGKPSQFTDTADDDEEETEGNNTQNEKKTANEEKTSTGKKIKKLYRDGDNRLLGGVSSGIGAYINMDTSLVRILFVVLTFLTSATFILVYLLLWIIIPKAKTTTQKLEMQGELVNIETIKNKATEAKEYLQSEEFQSTASTTSNRIGKVLTTILRVGLVFIGAAIAIIGILFIAALLVGLIIFMFEPDIVNSLNLPFLSNQNGDQIFLLIISLLLLIGCPIFALIYWGVNVNSKNKKATSNTPLWISFVMWIIGILMFAVTASKTAFNLKENLDNDDLIHSSWIYRFNFPDDNINAHIKENIILPEDIQAIETKGNIKLKLKQQDNKLIKISYKTKNLNFNDTSINKNLHTELVDGVFKIHNINNEQSQQQITVEIGIDSLTYIFADGAVDIESETPCNFSNLKIEARGASKINLDIIMAQKLDFNLEGASKLKLSGTADTLNINADGASKVDTEALKAKVVNIELNGASKAEVYASDSFTGVANGISRIDVEGQPKKKKIKNSTGSRIVFDD